MIMYNIMSEYRDTCFEYNENFVQGGWMMVL